MFPFFPQIRLTSRFEGKVQRFHQCEVKLTSLKADYDKNKDKLTAEQSRELMAIIEDCEVKLEALRADISMQTVRNGLIALIIFLISIAIVLTQCL